MPRVYLITGCSTGFGRELTIAILKAGDAVIATARDPSKLRFENTSKSNYLPLKLDVTSAASIEDAFEKAYAHFDRIDVVINNAGNGLAGVFEELKDAQITRQMDVNFHGTIRVTRTALRYMREQNKPSGGLILQITSIAGQIGIPCFSVYCASKWAVEGFTESVAKELKPEWNINLMCVEPGGFKTDWAHRSMEFRATENKLPVYDHMDAKEFVQDMGNVQAGDPVKGAKAIYELSKLEQPPFRTPLGSEAFSAMESKLKTETEIYRQWEEIALPVDLDGAPSHKQKH